IARPPAAKKTRTCVRPAGAVSTSASFSRDCRRSAPSPEPSRSLNRDGVLDRFHVYGGVGSRWPRVRAVADSGHQLRHARSRSADAGLKPGGRTVWAKANFAVVGLDASVRILL